LTCVGLIDHDRWVSDPVESRLRRRLRVIQVDGERVAGSTGAAICPLHTVVAVQRTTGVTEPTRLLGATTIEADLRRGRYIARERAVPLVRRGTVTLNWTWTDFVVVCTPAGFGATAVVDPPQPLAISAIRMTGINRDISVASRRGRCNIDRLVADRVPSLGGERQKLTAPGTGVQLNVPRRRWPARSVGEVRYSSCTPGRAARAGADVNVPLKPASVAVKVCRRPAAARS